MEDQKQDQQQVDAHQAYDEPAPFTNATDSSRRIPERQVYSAKEKAEWRLNGASITMTGGFMEPYGHGRKSFTTYYLDSQNPNPNKPAARAPGKYNIGIDYVVGGNKMVTPLYGGKVVPPTGLNGGYGNSVTIETNQSYEYNGQRYPIYNTYSHLASISNGIQVGATVTRNTYLGKMGGTGTGGKNVYPEHVDLQSYIIVDGKKVQISPNLVQENLRQQQNNGTFRYSQNDSVGNTVITSGSVVDANVSSLDNTASLKEQYKLILREYSSDGTSSGDVDTSSLVTDLRERGVASTQINAILSTHFEGKGFTGKQLHQHIEQSLSSADQNLVSTGNASSYQLG